VVVLNRGQHGDFDDGFRIGRPEVSEQQAGAKAD
jgi:hypothetical protein